MSSFIKLVASLMFSCPFSDNLSQACLKYMLTNRLVASGLKSMFQVLKISLSANIEFCRFTTLLVSVPTAT